MVSHQHSTLTKEGPLDDLAFSLGTICRHNRDGSEMTRAQRAQGLAMMAGALRDLGYRLPDARSLKPKHVEALLSTWRAEGISDATMKNRMSWLRWWAEKVQKPGLIPRDNGALGLADKVTFKGPRAEATGGDRMGALPERMQLAIRLQMAFGLRLEESLKLRPARADLGDRLALAPAWCKGGRPRDVPVINADQRALLDRLHQVCGGGSLIPAQHTFISFRKAFEKATLEAGIRNVHKHRHWYAQRRYEALSGFPCPAAGGPTHDGLTRAEQARLDAARLTVSRELGHNRIDVTDAYLGPRRAPRKAAA